MKIQALAVLKSGESLSPFEYEAILGPKDVLIDLKYCSMTKGDIRFMSNFWNDTKFPLVPSSEAFGTISQVGSEVKDLMVGDYIGLGYQMSSCHQCEYCLSGKEQFCLDQKVVCVGGFGGLAKQIVFDSRFVFKIPSSLQDPKYVPLMCSGLTVFSAIKRAGPKAGMKVGVVGIGNLGHLAVQILAKTGCEVSVFTHRPEKIAELLALGATEVIDSTSVDDLKNQTKKFDLILSTSSKALEWPLYISALKPLGNLMFVGLPEKEIIFPIEMMADYAQRGVLGSYIGSPSEMKELLELSSTYNLSADVKVVPIAQVSQAVADIVEDKSNFSTVIDLTDWK